jgi:hypothetical protein
MVAAADPTDAQIQGDRAILLAPPLLPEEDPHRCRDSPGSRGSMQRGRPHWSFGTAVGDERFGDVAAVLIQLRACQAALIRPVGRGAPRAPVWCESGVLRGLGRSLRRSDGELHADALRCSDRSGEGAREVIRAGPAVAKSTSLASVPSLDQGTRFLPITK